MTKSKVAICVPVKNSDCWLAKNLSLIDTFGKEISRVIISYGDSYDNTFELIRRWASTTKHKVEVIHEPETKYRVHSSGEIAFLYHDFQDMIEEGDETHALLWDGDILEAPSNLVKELLKHDKDIIAPYVYTKHHAPGKRFFDTFVYRYKGYRYHPFDPPMHNNKLAMIDSVGCVFLVKRKPFLEHRYRDPYPHMAFCNDARSSGYEVWVDPNMEIGHIDMERFGGGNQPVEMVQTSRFYNPKFVYPPMINNKGEIISDEKFVVELINKYIM